MTETNTTEKPMFIPLKTEWFRAFESGTKTEEWRRYGKRWDETTCRVGRRVVLSHGYSGARLTGRIVSFRRAPAAGPAVDLYGPAVECSVIGIALDGGAGRAISTAARHIEHTRAA